MPLFNNNRKAQRGAGDRTAAEREQARAERELHRAQRLGDAADSPPPAPTTDDTAQTDGREPRLPLENPDTASGPPALDPATPDSTAHTADAAEVHIDHPVMPVSEEITVPFQAAAEEPPVEDWMASSSSEEPDTHPGVLESLEQHTPDSGPVAERHDAEEIVVAPPQDAAIDPDPVEFSVPVKLPPPPPAPERLPPLPSGNRRRGKHRDPLLERRAKRVREHRKAPHPAGGRITWARATALLGLVVAIALIVFLVLLLQPLHGSGHGKVIVNIPARSSSSKIGSILQRDGVVSSGFFFELRAFLDGKRSDLHSGSFQLEKDMSYGAAISALSKPPPPKIPVKVLIPEGENRRQIADIARADGLTGSYLTASVHSPLLDPAHYGAPHGTPDLEGFLFPATYDMNAGTPVSKLVAEQLIAFGENFGRDEITAAHALHVTPYQVLIVASMVEREAQIAGDRPKIAAVIYNRLRLGMPLGIDASIYYAVELQKKIATYTGELTESQLHSDSPYNTRTHTGLPPTPISNPGLASIEAAAHPAHVTYLYYVAGADGCGEQVFSTTAAKFEADAAAYHEAVRKNGGKPPVCKHH
jgi:UPF0755 protein